MAEYYWDPEYPCLGTELIITMLIRQVETVAIEDVLFHELLKKNFNFKTDGSVEVWAKPKESGALPPMYCLKCFIHKKQKIPMTITGFPQPGLFNATCPICGWFVINALIDYYPNRPDFKDEPKKGEK
jgi:hypothetical protein